MIKQILTTQHSMHVYTHKYSNWTQYARWSIFILIWDLPCKRIFLLDFHNWAIIWIWVMLIIIGFSSGTASDRMVLCDHLKPTFLQNMKKLLTHNKTSSGRLMNHLSLLHQPLSLCGIQHVCFHQKALFKGVLINLPGREGTQVSVAAFPLLL